jgi:hypothetical protein
MNNDGKVIEDLRKNLGLDITHLLRIKRGYLRGGELCRCTALSDESGNRAVVMFDDHSFESVDVHHLENVPAEIAPRSGLQSAGVAPRSELIGEPEQEPAITLTEDEQSALPTWVKWLVKDRDGRVWGFSLEPFRNEQTNGWKNLSSQGAGQVVLARDFPPNHWTRSKTKIAAQASTKINDTGADGCKMDESGESGENGENGESGENDEYFNLHTR